MDYPIFEHDVIVIGAGGAGLRAAIEASGAGVSVGLICKSLLGKAHTVMAEGGVAASLANVDERDNWRVHFSDTMRGGQYLNNWRMAELHAREAPDRVRELEAWDGESPAHAASAKDELVSLKPESPLGFDGVLVYESRGGSKVVQLGGRQSQCLAQQETQNRHIDRVHGSPVAGALGQPLLEFLRRLAQRAGQLGELRAAEDQHDDEEDDDELRCPESSHEMSFRPSHGSHQDLDAP